MTSKFFGKSLLSALLIAGILPFTTTAATGTFHWKNVEIGGGGGFVPGIIYSETQPGLVYARTDMGGLYRRDSVTKVWKPLTDWVAPEQWNMLGGESFATDPIHPNICYFAAGTYTNDWTDMNGVILRSTNYGDTWQGNSMPIKFGGNMPGRSMGERLSIDPNSDNILYFGARSGKGLWKSIDSGVTWNQVTSFPVTGDYIQDSAYAYTADPLGIVWVAYDKSSSTLGTATQRLFAGVAQKAGSTLYMSEDAGATWAPVAGQPLGPDTSHIMPHHGIIRNGVLYVDYNNKGGPYDGSYGEVWKYDIAGKTWTDITPHSHWKDESWGTATLQTEKPWYGYGGLTVDPQNSNVIMVSTLNSWWPDNMIYRSTDGGASWTRSFYFTSYPSASFKYQMVLTFPWLNWGVKDQWPDVVAQKFGWMMGSMAINPFDSTEMMYGTGATIYGTNNLTDWGSANKVKLSSFAEGIEECAVLSLAVPPIATGANADVKLITGVGDIGGFTHTDLHASTQMFQTPRFGHTSSIDYAELSPTTVVRVGTASPDKYEAKNNLATSGDGGKTWTKVYALDTTYADGSVAMSAKGSFLMWAAAGKSVYAGSAYGLAKTNLPIDAYVASDRVSDSIFYAFKDSLLYTGTGVTYTASTVKVPTSSSKIKAVPGNLGHVWIPAGKQGLWLTQDGGKTIAQVAAATVQQADVVGFGKAIDGGTYPTVFITGMVSNKTGVYMSTDMGATWIRVNDDSHQYGAINFAITGDMRTFGIVFVGTNGRGVVYGDTNSADTSSGSSGTVVKTLPQIASQAPSFKAFKTDHLLLVSQIPTGATVEIFNTQGRLLASKVHAARDERFAVPASALFIIRVKTATVQMVKVL